MRLEAIFDKIKQIRTRAVGQAIVGVVLVVSMGLYPTVFFAKNKAAYESVQACVIPKEQVLSRFDRLRIARCLGWQTHAQFPVCHGAYTPLIVRTPAREKEIRVAADEVSFYPQGRSTLSGHVEVQQGTRVVNAETAYVYRDEKNNRISKIELVNGVRFKEPDHLMLAKRVELYPEAHTGKIEHALYRLDLPNKRGILPAWGRARLIERFANENLALNHATYTTCPPNDNAWEISADDIRIDKAKGEGVARHAKLYVRDVPVFYAPYFSFPTTKERKSGFLMPSIGQSNISGTALSLPYYWNIAPNYDATITPQWYSLRGFMIGGQFRYLTEQSAGVFEGHYMPHDKAFGQFLDANRDAFPVLNADHTDRWSVQYHNLTQFNPHWKLNVDVQQVSDDYYLQDFSSNLAIVTERQILRQGDLMYSDDHWLVQGMLQSYYTLQPINATPISEIYQRLPQLMAIGQYDDLPLNANVALRGQYDQFVWPNNLLTMPQGPRFYVNPILSLPQTKPWGYLTPSVELVQRNYDVSYQHSPLSQSFNRTIPRFSVDSGLYFDKTYTMRGQTMTQTLEPRMYYLWVPYRDQTPIPVYDSAYMIFSTDQLFRTNRFSGFDRIGDANQLSYALTSRFLEEDTGVERAVFTVGQIRYFSQRQVMLCQSLEGLCLDDPLYLGFLSPTSTTSPVASRMVYRINPVLSAVGDYVWDTATRSTNNADFTLYYQPRENHIVSLGYTYLVNGDITQVANSTIQNNAMNQGTAAFAWPINDSWRALGAYSYNLSKRYEMMSFFGVQYDNCCWAVRLVGGRTFQSLTEQLRPQYNNNIYVQILLKGLGSAGYNDPASRIQTYLPGYVDYFHGR